MRVITTSLLKSFLNCPLQAYYQEQGLQKPLKPGSPLSRGTYIHELIEKGTAEIPDAGEMFEEELELYKGYDYLYEAYCFNWRNSNWRRVKTEFKLSRQIAPDVVYQGKIDELVLIDNKVWIVDHKTHKQLPSTETRLLDIQSDAYIWLLTPWLKKHGMLDGTAKYSFGGFIWDYLIMDKIKTPAFVKDGSKLKRYSGDALPFTDYTTLCRVLLAEGVVESIDGVNVEWANNNIGEDERLYIEAHLNSLYNTPCGAFQRYHVPYDVEQHKRQVAFILKTAKAFCEYDFSAKPILRNVSLCGQRCNCDFVPLAVAELVTGDDMAARGDYLHVDPLARYESKEKGK